MGYGDERWIELAMDSYNKHETNLSVVSLYTEQVGQEITL
jgi:hypothetical protein